MSVIINVTTSELWAQSKKLNDLAKRVGDLSLRNRRAIDRMNNACSSMYVTGMYKSNTLMISKFTNITSALNRGCSRAMDAVLAYEDADEELKKTYKDWFSSVELNTIDQSAELFKKDQELKAQHYLPSWVQKRDKSDNKFNCANGTIGSVAYFNRPKELSCTYYTLRKLREKGLDYPFLRYGANGKQWYENCDSSVPGTTGKDCLSTLMENYGKGVKGDYFALHNIVISMDRVGSTWGHVVLIDTLERDSNGKLWVTYSDMNGLRMTDGTYPNPIINTQYGSNAPRRQSLDDFLETYCTGRNFKNKCGYEIIGARLIGNP